MRQLFDKTVDVKQLFVDEYHGLLVLRADKGDYFSCLILTSFIVLVVNVHQFIF